MVGAPPEGASARTFCLMVAACKGLARHFHAGDLAILALHAHLERTATDLAIRRETLALDARIHAHVKRLAAERALHIGELLHFHDYIMLRLLVEG